MISWRKHAYFAGHRLIGSHIAEYYREFLKMESSSPKELERLREERLRQLLMHARGQIPFYRECCGKNSQPLLEDFPILTKRDVKEGRLDLMSPQLRREYESGRKRKGYGWVEVKTGGSTGVPTTMIHDAEFRDRGRASRLYAQHLCGFPLGTPYFMLWGSMRDINASRDSVEKRALNFLLNTRILNAFRMDESRLREYVERLNASSIQHLMGYADACDQMARFIQREGLRVKPLKAVMACGGTVTPEMRERIERVFSTRVHNKYGSRDCTDMACECERGGFHIFDHHLVIEVVNEKGKRVAPGVLGKILVTPLHNYSFPLIRYEIGDVGALSGKACSCGRPFPLLEKVEGRGIEMLTDTRGNFITPIYIRHMIGVVHNSGDCLQRFQLTQYGGGRYELLLQAREEDRNFVTGEILPKIRRDLMAALGEEARLTIEFAETIEETGSGKFLYVRNLAEGKTEGERSRVN
jgi:phenylacetate-CoA ligase